MKRKIIILILLLILLTGCNRGITVKQATSNYLDNYINLNDTVLKQLVNQASRYYQDEQVRDKYIEVLKKQYSNLEYRIIKEKYDGEFAYAIVEVRVYDLYSAQKKALENINNYLLTDGSYDKTNFNLYKLDLMLDTTEKIVNNITIKLLKEGKKWEVLQLSNENLEKLHGIYNYES